MKYDDTFFEGLDEDLSIDQYRLEKEWLRQPQKYIKYAMASAHFAKKASEAAEAVKIIEAELEADAAEDPEACLGRGVKATADRIKGYARTHPERARVAQRAINAKYNADMALSAVFAMQQRKDALEQLVRLQGMELNSEPRSNNRAFTEGASQRAVDNAIKERGVRKVQRRS